MFEDIPHLRKGQAVSGFLIWLARHPKIWVKKYTTYTSFDNVFYDPFNMKDEEFERYYNEWLHEAELKEIEQKLLKLAKDGTVSKGSTVWTEINGKRYTIISEDVALYATESSKYQVKTQPYP